MNHFHLITLISTFDLDWPVLFQKFFALLKPISEISTQFLSIDCFLDKRSNNDDDTTLDASTDLWRIYF